MCIIFAKLLLKQRQKTFTLTLIKNLYYVFKNIKKKSTYVSKRYLSPLVLKILA